MPMDERILSELNDTAIQEVLTLWSSVQKDDATIQRLRDTVNNAQKTLTELQSNDPAARENLETLVKIHERVEKATQNLRSMADPTGDVPSVAAVVMRVSVGLNNPQAMAAPDISGLQKVISVYDRLQNLRENEVRFAQDALLNFVNQWLNNDKAFDLGGVQTVHLRFTSTPASSMFSPTVNLTAEAAYGPVKFTMKGLYFQVNAQDALIPDFSTAKVDFNPNSLTSVLANALKDIPLPGLSLTQPELDISSIPPCLTLLAEFSGIPGFEAIAFKARLQVAANGNVTPQGGVGMKIPTFFLVIGPTGVAFQTLSANYEPPPDNKLSLGTNIVPAAPGAGNLLTLEDLTVTFPLSNPGQGITFTGAISLAGQKAGLVDKGILSVTEVNAHVRIPAGECSTPFGSFFSLDANFHADPKGLNFDGEATLLEVFEGDVKAFIGFDGVGFVSSSVEAKALGADASFTASWEPGFKNLNVRAVASLKINVNGFKLVSVSAALSAILNDSSAALNVSTKILGIPIDVDLIYPWVKSLKAFLEQKVGNQLEALGNRLFQGAKDLCAEADPFNKNSALRKGLASLDPFASNSEAQKVFQDIGDAVNDLFAVISRPVDLIKICMPFSRSRVLLIGGEGTLSDADISIINRLKDAIAELGKALSETSVKQTISQGTGTLSNNWKVESEFDIVFDQVNVGLGEIKACGFHNAVIAFLISGNSFTQRSGHVLTGSFSEWGYISVKEIHPLGNWGEIKIPLLDASDASLLHARHHVYHVLKNLVKAKLPEIHIGDIQHLDVAIDSNDPGPIPPVNPMTDQPPAGELPVLRVINPAPIDEGGPANPPPL